MGFMRLFRGSGFVLLALVMVLVGTWCSIAIWYQCGAGEPLCGFLTGTAVTLTLIAVAFLATRRRWIIAGIYSAAVGAFLGSWARISPTNDRQWAPDVARSMTAAIDGEGIV